MDGPSNSQFSEAFANLGEIYQEEASDMHPQQLGRLVDQTIREGMYSYEEGMARRYPSDISDELNDEFQIGGAL